MRHLWLVVLLLITQSANADCVIGNGSPSSCTQSAVMACGTAGVTITFNCGGTIDAPTLIAWNSPWVLHGADTIITIDGGNTVEFHGNLTDHLFELTNYAHLTLKNLGLSGGSGKQNVVQSDYKCRGYCDGVYLASSVTCSSDADCVGVGTGPRAGICLNKGCGGAIHSTSGNLTIDHCVFHDNIANVGAAVRVLGTGTNTALFNVYNSEFYHNTVLGGCPQQGGVLYIASSFYGLTHLDNLWIHDNDGSAFTTISFGGWIRNSRIERNYSTAGAGICTWGYWETIGSTYINNVAGRHHPEMKDWHSGLVWGPDVEWCTGNALGAVTPYPCAVGGAIMAYGNGDVGIAETSFIGNSAKAVTPCPNGDGLCGLGGAYAAFFGGRFASAGHMIDTDTWICEPRQAGCLQAPNIAQDITWYGNSADVAGGALVLNFPSTGHGSAVFFSTFDSNTAPIGANIYIPAGNQLTLHNSIVSNPIGGFNCEGPGTVAVGNNNISYGTAGTCNTSDFTVAGTNPVGALGDFGGTPFISYGFIPQVLELPSNSPAINVAAPADCATILRDERRYPKGGPYGCSSGATEYYPDCCTVQTGTGGTQVHYGCEDKTCQQCVCLLPSTAYCCTAPWDAGCVSAVEGVCADQCSQHSYSCVATPTVNPLWTATPTPNPSTIIPTRIPTNTPLIFPTFTATPTPSPSFQTTPICCEFEQVQANCSESTSGTCPSGGVINADSSCL